MYTIFSLRSHPIPTQTRAGSDASFDQQHFRPGFRSMDAELAGGRVGRFSRQVVHAHFCRRRLQRRRRRSGSELYRLELQWIRRRRRIRVQASLHLVLRSQRFGYVCVCEYVRGVIETVDVRLFGVKYDM